MRNFWVELRVDGQKTIRATGPQRKDGGFRLTIRQRNKGASEEVLRVFGEANPDGTLTLVVEPTNIYVWQGQSSDHDGWDMTTER